MSEFTLTPPGPDALTLEQVQATKTRIGDLAMRRKRRRPTLEQWSFRIETNVHHDLARLAKQMDPISMADIVNGLLEIWVPAMLRGQGTSQQPAQQGIDANQVQQIATAVAAAVAQAIGRTTT